MVYNSLQSLKKLSSDITSVADCGIITSDVNRRYFTGMKSSAGIVLVFPEQVYFIIDFRYIEKASKLLDSINFVEVVMQDRLYEQINSLLEKHNAKTVAVESDWCTVSQLEEFRTKLNAEIVSDNLFSERINQLRFVKTQAEIDKIISAQRIAEKGFEHILEFIRAGRTEREIQLELDYFMLKNGAEALSFDTIALSGKNTSLPHGVPSDKLVQNGEFVLLDFGAVVDGYHSDMTRTVCVGQPTEEMKAVYRIVLDAQLAGLKAVRAGITGRELDKIARDIIVQTGYGEQFGHSLGHGVGMEIHEAPTASPRTDEELLVNSIVTIEPGIYLPGKFGVRIEDFVIVKENGCDNMTLAPKELIVL
ncbi:MAG: aminopeptidase P family protein [Ruminococcus sp.]|nr:aminopeptidase P family protein [Ruminococcus sp.]